MFQKIEPECIEELTQAVTPWQLTLRQLSEGELGARLTFTAINETLVSNDRWQGCVHGQGKSSRDFFTIVGSREVFEIPWNGTVLSQNTLACNASDMDWEFVTPAGTDHWVVMIPTQKLADYMGVEASQILPHDSILLQCSPTQFRHFDVLLNRIFTGYLEAAPCTKTAMSEIQLEASVIAEMADMLTNASANGEGSTARARYAAYRKAIDRASNSRDALTIQALAAAAGVSVRVLQLAFKEHLGYSPYRFLRLCRLNQLRSVLLDHRRQNASVTRLMEELNFHELGRTAGEYKRLFGESPSRTLARHSNLPPERILDALNTGPTKGHTPPTQDVVNANQAL